MSEQLSGPGTIYREKGWFGWVSVDFKLLADSTSLHSDDHRYGKPAPVSQVPQVWS